MNTKPSTGDTPLAIIGMGCLFPLAQDLKGFWNLLFHGRDGIGEIPATHWSPEAYFSPDPKAPDRTYCRRGGFLSPIPFDPSEFGIPPSSLEATDTSQLLGLVAARAALQDAGYWQKASRLKTSVILGVTGTQELVIPLGARLGHPIWKKALAQAGIEGEKAAEVMAHIADAYVPWQENSFPGLLGNVVAGRISNRLDLKGTNCVVDAACASSMGAIHLAMLELSSGRADLVVTGGVDTLNDIFMHMCFSKSQVLSFSGDARPFSKHADGTVLGEGVGLLVLKRLPEAEKDGDRIYAVIKGIGSASDGRSSSIYAPRAEGQALALTTAYGKAAVDPEGVELVEAHGTGTRVGDQVEFQALKSVFAEAAPDRRNWCALGSVKSNIGHTKAAAGAAGIIKSALSLYHKVLPPTLKVEEPDPGLDIQESPFYLNTVARPWLSPEGRPRRAGVSAFGFGGSNFHVVLEEYGPQKKAPSWDGSVELAAFSAASLAELKAGIRAFLEAAAADPSPARRAFLAGQSRSRFSCLDRYRLCWVWEDTAGAFPPDKLLSELETRRWDRPWQSGGLYFGLQETPGRLAFIFPGQGSQYTGMGRDLVCIFPEALEAIHLADRACGPDLSLGLSIYPIPDHGPEDQKRLEEALTRTETAQPAIGAVSLAMLKVLRRFGIEPDLSGGHSFGELTALCAAGWLEEHDFLSLARQRGRFMAEAAHGEGSMLAVQAPLAELEEALARRPDQDLVLANRNSPSQGVLSGPTAAIEKAQAWCLEKGWRCRRLPVAAAFHSSAMAQARKRFQGALAKIGIKPQAVPVYANRLARPYPARASQARKLLSEQITHPVDFAGQIEAMRQDGAAVFLEVGPRSVLTGLVKSILGDRDALALSLDRSGGCSSGLADLGRVLAQLAALGYPVDFSRWEAPPVDPPSQRMRIPICGANYRNPQSAQAIKPPAAARTQTLEPEPATSMAETAATSEPGKMDIKEKRPKEGPPLADVPSPDAVPSPMLENAFRLVQEGLRSMQELQLKTAEAHQKFLETQTEAGRVLQQMMESTQQLAQRALGIDPLPDRGLLSPKEGRPLSRVGIQETGFTQTHTRNQAPEPGTTVSVQGVPAPDAGNPPVRTTRGQVSLPPETAAPETVSEPARSPSIGNTLLEVVSLLTGYPMEMLGLDMDIEADLGIDSIKRVEILSALEERVPGLPQVPPDVLGSLKTLGEIAAILSPEQQAGDGPDPDPRPSMPPLRPEIPSGKTASPAVPDTGSLAGTLLEVVSLLTGYPMEMLGLDMDIEADLGIDSIKRVEILSALEERVPGLPQVPPDVLGSLKTLGEIAAHLSRPGKRTAEAEPIPSSAGPETPPQGAAEPMRPPEDDEPRPVPRFHTQAVEAESATGNGRLLLPPEGLIYVVDDRGELARALVAEFQSRGLKAKLTSLKVRNLSRAAGLVLLPPAALLKATRSRPKDDDFLKAAFQLTRKAAPALIEAGRSGGALCAAVMRMDGALGFGSTGRFNPVQGGLAGLVKCAALEWPAVTCRALDLDPDWEDTAAAARAAVAEMLATGPDLPLETGLSEGCRRYLEQAVAPHRDLLPLDLPPGGTVVISGGARGVTAACALELARQYRPSIALLGRSPAPEAEPLWLAGLTDVAQIKQAILAHAFQNRAASPRELEQAFRAAMASREIAANLTAMEAAGASVRYYAVDIRQSDPLQSTLAQIRDAFGPIQGIIHGAGVLEDRLILDKTPSQLDTVYDTKVTGLRNLLAACRKDPVKHLVLFSSVSARFGNKGQADYAMANEVLNKTACQEKLARPDCRVRAVNWGPWDGGMVSPSLKREFARQGIELISMADGARSLVEEMRTALTAPAEVVIGHGLRGGNASGMETPSASPGEAHYRLCFEDQLDLDRFPVLTSHRLDGKPVVPLALMAEWCGHGALHDNPGLLFCGLDDIRVLSGIKLNNAPHPVQLMAGRLSRKGELYEVAVELSSGNNGDRRVVHSTARAILSDDAPKAPPAETEEELELTPYFRDLDEVYDRILFHGEKLRGIRKIIGYSPGGMKAEIAASPHPSIWIKEPLRNHWITDPLALDAAFQLASLWCFETKGMVSLPSHVAGYRQYCRAFPQNGLSVTLAVKTVTSRKMTGEFRFAGPDQELVARITGYEAIMDPELIKAFKPEN